MAYYIRVLGTETGTPSLDALRNSALPALLDMVGHSDETWTQIALRHESGEEIALIERNRTQEGLGADELAEFIEEVEAYEPVNAAQWLKSYLLRVKVIYAFQVLAGTDTAGGWDRLHAVHAALWNHAKGLLQADGEGFSNEEGYTILWQFGPTASGKWNFAVLADDQTWISFEMELGDLTQRQMFQRGELPTNAKNVRKHQA